MSCSLLIPGPLSSIVIKVLSGCGLVIAIAISPDDHFPALSSKLPISSSRSSRSPKEVAFSSIRQLIFSCRLEYICFITLISSGRSSAGLKRWVEPPLPASRARFSSRLISWLIRSICFCASGNCCCMFCCRSVSRY